MTPEPGYYLSLLMGAPGVSDAELARMDIEVLERFGSAVRGLLVPARSVTPYQELLRAAPESKRRLKFPCSRDGREEPRSGGRDPGQAAKVRRGDQLPRPGGERHETATCGVQKVLGRSRAVSYHVNCGERL